MISARLDERITTGNDYVAFDAVYHDNKDHDIDDIDDDDDERIIIFFQSRVHGKGVRDDCSSR